jgi:opacity protein-like surface antigen
MLHKLRIALAATVLALAAVSAADSASAGFYGGGVFGYFGFDLVVAP